ncbi:hypothetical protein ABPG75_006841, partial [Micractinium tetrahymenae]
QGLKSGAYFRGVLRVNASDRTQAFCTLPGLPTDVFIRVLKQQNRAVEGDEVAIRLLPPEDWYQLSSAKAAAEAAAAAAEAEAGAAGAATPQQAAAGVTGVASNVVPLPSRLRLGAAATAAAGAAPPPTPLTAAVGVGPAAMTPPVWAGAQQRRSTGDLVASPALVPSASGGDLAVALGPTDAAESESEESEQGSVSSEGELATEEQEALLEVVEEDLLGLKLDTDVAALMEAEGAAEDATEGATEEAAVPPAQPQEQQQQVDAEAAQQAAPAQPAAAVELPQVEEAEQEEPEGEAESMVDFLLRSRLEGTPPPAGGAAGTPGTAAGSAGPAGGLQVDPRLHTWHPVGQGAEVALGCVAERLRQQGEGWRVTGEVVAILEPSRRRETVVGVLKQEGEKDTGTFFLIPCDPRMPRMIVRSALLPPQIKQALKQEAQTAELAARTLVSARVASWEACFPFPQAQVRASIGQAGDLATETAALLSMEQVKDDDQFSPEVLACLPPTPWTICEEELAKRRDFRQTRIFSIDPPTARDLDDALSVEELPGGGYRVGVHIADVSHFVMPGTALDREAQQRSTSVYLVDRVIPMLPRLLCEELCSLNPGVDRLAFSVVWDMTEEGDITSTWAGRSVIRSCGKLAYPHVQRMIEGDFLALEGQEPPPVELSGRHTWPQVVQDSLTLHRIASSLRRRRFDGGALRLDNTRLFFKLDEQGNPHNYGVCEQREANQLVEEFMLLANMTTARMVAEAWPDRALLRCHPPPNMHKMVELSRTAAELGFELDTSGAGPLQRSLAALREAASTDPAALEVITLLATKPMQNARYFCTGETPDESFWRHFALAVSHYTHFTSPIRRYPDIIVHRLMAALLDQQGGTRERSSRHGLFPSKMVGQIAAHANDRKLAAKSVQDGSLRLYLCVMLHRQPLVCGAVVMQLGGSRFFDCYIPALGCDVRIHTNSLLRGGDGAVEAGWQPNDKVLTVRRTAGAEADEPDFSDIPNLASLRNPGGLAPAALPLTLRMLCHVPILVSSRRSQTSGSPTHVVAKLWLAPLPAEAAAAAEALAAAAVAPLPLHEALAQGIQESFD